MRTPVSFLIVPSQTRAFVGRVVYLATNLYPGPPLPSPRGRILKTKLGTDDERLSVKDCVSRVDEIVDRQGASAGENQS